MIERSHVCGHMIKWKRELILNQNYLKEKKKPKPFLTQFIAQYHKQLCRHRGVVIEAGTKDSSLEQNTGAAYADTASERNAQTRPVSTSRWRKLPVSQSIVDTF